MSTPLRTLLVGLLFACCSLAWTFPANASQDAMRAALEDFLLARTVDLPGKVSFEIGKLPESERLAACQGWQAFLPAGARAWGRVSVGMRCVAGTNASFYASVRVTVEGRYLVAARPIANGQTIAPEDIRPAQGELTTQAPDLLLNEAEAIGQIARTAIPAERPLQASFLRPQPVIQAGQVVKVITHGQGFTVSNEGQALSAASLGQTLRIRLANGAIVSGIARGNGLAEIRN